MCVEVSKISDKYIKFKEKFNCNTIEYLVERPPVLVESVDDFQERNQQLMQSITSLVSSQQFARFKTLSVEFRQNQLDADAYFRDCSQALGRQNFAQIFPELLVLLPDVAKQSELLDAYERQSNNNSAATGKPWRDSHFQCCAVCRQVLSTRDVAAHMLLAHSHAQQSDFPVLGFGSLSNGSNAALGSWSVKS